MRSVLDERCGKNQNTHVLYSVTFFENRAVYEKMSKNMVEFGGTQITSQNGAYELRAG
jgi:hypothetical protein